MKAGRCSPLRLATQQRHRLRHDQVGIDCETVFDTDGIERPLEGVACVSFSEVRLPTVAGQRDEVMVSVSPFQPDCHSGKPCILQPHIWMLQMWGAKCGCEMWLSAF